MYEYCVMHHMYPNEPHRGPMPLDEAELWVDDYLDDGGRPGAFYVAKREVGPWIQEI
jgi:hypothetical protein